MNITIHQPSYLPWIPFLEKGLQSDVYVMLDQVQFEKNSELNRNRIKTVRGEIWLTVPVKRRLHTLLSEVRIATEEPWKRKHRRAIEENYREAPSFEKIAPTVFDLIEGAGESLLDLNLALDELFLRWSGFEGRIVRASELDAPGTGSERILNLCQALGGTKYFSGAGGLDYLDLSSFADANIEVVFQRYQHQEYSQRFPALGFLSHLSALDLFMNLGVGPSVRQFILSNARWVTADAAACL